MADPLPLQADRPNTEHLLSERALRERIEELSARVEEPGELLAQLDAAIRESRESPRSARLRSSVSERDQAVTNSW